MEAEAEAEAASFKKLEAEAEAEALHAEAEAEAEAIKNSPLPHHWLKLITKIEWKHEFWFFLKNEKNEFEKPKFDS